MGSVFSILLNLATYILAPRAAGAGVAYAFRIQLAQGTAVEGVRRSRAESSMESSVGHVSIDIPAPSLGEDAGVANASDVQPQGTVEEGDLDGGDGAGSHVSQVIILAICSQGTAGAAAIHKGLREVSPSTADKYKVAYLLAIAGVFVAGFAQMLAAIWVSYNTGTRGAAGKKILYASLVTLLLGIMLDAFAYLLNK